MGPLILCKVNACRRKSSLNKRADTTLKRKGVALIEFLIVIPILLIFWVSLVNLSSLYVIKQKLTLFSRYSVWLVKDEMPASLVTIKMKEGLLKNKFFRQGFIDININKEGLSVFYKSFENVVQVKYTAYLFPAYFPPYILQEKCALSGGSWQIKDKLKRGKTNYEDMVKNN